MITLHNIDQGTEEWLAKREFRFTGSNAHKLLSTFGAGNHAKAGVSAFRGNFWTKRGHALEDEAIELYERIVGHKVIRPGFVTNDKYPDGLFSPDALDEFDAPTVIEVKCFDLPEHNKLLAGQIDIKILAQIHFGMLITGYKKGILLAYNPKAPTVAEKFAIIQIPYNRNIQNNFKRILTPQKDTV